MDIKKYDYEFLKKGATGNHEEYEDYKIIVYPFGKYEIKVKVTPKNEFIGISEIKINKDFLSHAHKLRSTGIHDVDEFYQD